MEWIKKICFFFLSLKIITTIIVVSQILFIYFFIQDSFFITHKINLQKKTINITITKAIFSTNYKCMYMYIFILINKQYK